jgi:hypothetical protein
VIRPVSQPDDRQSGQDHGKTAHQNTPSTCGRPSREASTASAAASVRVAIRSFADRARGFVAISASSGAIAFFGVRTKPGSRGPRPAHGASRRRRNGGRALGKEALGDPVFEGMERHDDQLAAPAVARARRHSGPQPVGQAHHSPQCGAPERCGSRDGSAPASCVAGRIPRAPQVSGSCRWAPWRVRPRSRAIRRAARSSP